MVNFSNRLKELRRINNVTQLALAQSLNIPQTTISTWENRYSEPSYYNLIRIAEFFNVTLDYLLDRDIIPNTVTDVATTSPTNVIEIPHSDISAETNKGEKLTTDEEALLYKYRKLSLFQKASVMGYLDGFLATAIE